VGSRLRNGSARAIALLGGLVALSGAVASAQTLGPNPAQVQELISGDLDEPLALVRFLRAGGPSAFARYLTELEQDVRSRGGERVYGGRIDAGAAGGTLYFDALVIDVFPSRRVCVESLRAIDMSVVSAGLEDSFVLVARPWGRATQLAANALASIFGTLFAREVRDAPSLTQAPESVTGSREIWPDPEALRFFEEEEDSSAPVAMLNLNQFRAQASYAPGSVGDPDVSGETAIRRYARVVVPQVMRRGGRVLFAGEPFGIAVGAEGNPLAGPWDQLVLVRYPSRRAINDLVADPDYRGGALHRIAALAHALNLATTPWPDFELQQP
jgi:uncharacterized protein (DUF1330 family)